MNWSQQPPEHQELRKQMVDRVYRIPSNAFALAEEIEKLYAEKIDPFFWADLLRLYHGDELFYAARGIYAGKQKS